MKIRSAERDDLPRILAIQKRAYLSEAAIYGDYAIPPLLQSLEEMNEEFESKTFLKADVDGVLVGSVRVKLVDATCLIERLSVDPQFQKRGIGSALLARAESVFTEASRFELFTGSRSTANLRFYERHGYARFHEQQLSSAVTLVYMQKLRGPSKLLQGTRETRGSADGKGKERRTPLTSGAVPRYVPPRMVCGAVCRQATPCSL